MIRTVLYAVVMLGAVVWAAFTVYFAATRPFWRSHVGWNLLGMGASLAVLLGAFGWHYWFGPIRLAVWLGLAVAVTAVGVHRFVLLVRADRGPRA